MINIKFAVNKEGKYLFSIDNEAKVTGFMITDEDIERMGIKEVFNLIAGATENAIKLLGESKDA